MVDKEKGIEVLLYIVNKLGNVSYSDVIAICYWADRYSLSKYGRFIYGDSYRAMEKPTPFFIYNVLRGQEESRFCSQVKMEVTVKGVFIEAFRSSDLDQLSESDIKSIDYVINSGDFDYKEEELNSLVKIGQEIPFDLFVDRSENPKELRDYIKSHQF